MALIQIIIKSLAIKMLVTYLKMTESIENKRRRGSSLHKKGIRKILGSYTKYGLVLYDAIWKYDYAAVLALTRHVMFV